MIARIKPDATDNPVTIGEDLDSLLLAGLALQLGFLVKERRLAGRAEHLELQTSGSTGHGRRHGQRPAVEIEQSGKQDQLCRLPLSTVPAGDSPAGQLISRT